MKKNTRFSTIIFLLLILYFCFACKTDLEFSVAEKPVGLSKDTILFDTVFTSNRTQTYKLLLYNRENKAIEIPKIYLEKGNNSRYKINVNGMKTFEASHVALRNNDSLYVFVELAASENLPHASVYEDNLIIKTLSGYQIVTLHSFIEKAAYLYPKNADNELLIDKDQKWDSSTSHVIYKTVRFINNSQLTIHKGARIYFHENSKLVFSDGTKLHVNGTIENKVIFRSDKHSSEFENLPNQWSAIELEKGSEATISNAIIKGGKIGLRINEAVVDLTNVQLYNHTFQGIYATNATLVAKNLVINNCGDASLRIQKGGNYQFYHSTFANYWNLSPISSPISVAISNRLSSSAVEDNKPLTQCVFGNCIFEGNSKNSLFIDTLFDKSLLFNYTIDYSLIKYENNPGEVSLNPKITHSIINGQSLFLNPSFTKNNLRLGETSDAMNKGNAYYSSIIPNNIEGKPRVSPSNLGAF